jgi:hypothetical protein
MAVSNVIGGGQRSQSYLGTKAPNPANVIPAKRDPTSDDVAGYVPGTLWINIATIETNGEQQATWYKIAPSGSTVTLTGDTGGPLESTSFTFTGTSGGSTVAFSGSTTTLSLQLSDSNSNTLLGTGAGAAGPGSTNTGVGSNVLGSLSGSAGNSAFGTSALGALTGGNSNTGIGNSSLDALQTGTFNTALGASSGDLLSSAESSNIYIGYNTRGSAGVSNRCRIGNGTGTGNGQLNSTFIAGINGINVTGAQVLVSASDQLGITVSSRKYKDNITDMHDASNDIYKLRPVTFSLKIRCIMA